MHDDLIAFISKFPSLTQDEVAAIAEQLTVRSAEKGTILVHAGDISNECYFVLKGCLRQYLIVDGIEKTTQFYTEEQAAVLRNSFSNKVKSDSYLSCLEDSLLIIGSLGTEMDMYQQFPKLQQITRMMMEQDLGKTQDALAFFITSSPEERYLHLLKTRPDLLQRAPQHQLASYIGVTPESLSRIRKRILKSS